MREHNDKHVVLLDFVLLVAKNSISALSLFCLRKHVLRSDATIQACEVVVACGCVAACRFDNDIGRFGIRFHHVYYIRDEASPVVFAKRGRCVSTRMSSEEDARLVNPSSEADLYLIALTASHIVVAINGASAGMQKTK